MAISAKYCRLATQLASVPHMSITESWELFLRSFDTGVSESDSLFALACACVDWYASSMKISHNTVSKLLIKTHKEKNAGYSGNNEDPFHNFKQCERFHVAPYYGVLVRMSDKYQRYVNISAAPELEQVNEKLQDTVLDLASYALIAICLREESI